MEQPSVSEVRILKRARPSATNWHRVVHFLFKEDRLFSDLIDEVAIRWN
jgi:hypothetical protein